MHWRWYLLIALLMLSKKLPFPFLPTEIHWSAKNQFLCWHHVLRCGKRLGQDITDIILQVDVAEHHNLSRCSLSCPMIIYMPGVFHQHRQWHSCVQDYAQVVTEQHGRSFYWYPSIRRLWQYSIINSVAILATTISDPYVEVSTVFCHFDTYRTGVLLMNNTIPVTERFVTSSWA